MIQRAGFLCKVGIKRARLLWCRELGCSVKLGCTHLGCCGTEN